MSSCERKKIEVLISMLKKYESEYPFLKKLLWELWAYDFESVTNKEIEKELEPDIIEIIKMLKLLYGPAYM